MRMTANSCFKVFLLCQSIFLGSSGSSRGSSSGCGGDRGSGSATTAVSYNQWLLNHTERVREGGGDWLKASPTECQQSPVCVDDKEFGNITWRTEPAFEVFTNDTACALLAQLGYKRIYLIGDSFTRHVYQALLLVLSGDFEWGSLNSRQSPECRGEKQFAEKACSGTNARSKPYRSACLASSPVNLGFYDVFRFRYTPDLFPRADRDALLLWSEGSHPPLFNYSAGGRNSFAGYQDKFTRHYNICRNDHTNMTNATNATATSPPLRNVMWMSTHLRPFKGKHHEEKLRVITRFNQQMRAFFAAQRCGDVGYVDVLAMTAALQHPALRGNLAALTYDGMHFKRTVNVLKAQLMLNALRQWREKV